MPNMDYSLIQRTPDGTGKILVTIPGSPDKGSYVLEADLKIYTNQGMVAIADIVDDLVTADATKPLSANQGVVLKQLIDAVSGGITPKGDILSTNLPAADDSNKGWQYYCTDLNKYATSDGTQWVYTSNSQIVQTPDATDTGHALSNAVVTQKCNAVEATLNQHDARLQNLEQKAGDYTTVEYRGTDAVPTGKAHYGLVKNIVGKSRAWNQMVDSGTSSVTLTNGHKYLTVINGTFSIVIGAGSAISVTGGTDCVYDLTLIFGAGNEPATVADALAQLSALGQYNAYDAGSLVDTVVSGVESRDTSDNLLDTLSLPEPVTLRSAGSVADELNIESGVITRKVGVVDLGTLAWSYRSEYQIFYAYLPSAKMFASDTIPNCICPNYVSINWVAIFSADKCICTASAFTNGIHFKDSSYDDTDLDSSNKAPWLNGKYLVYELETPTTESIDPIPDNTLYTEGGGTIETIQTQTPTLDNCLDVGYLAV